MDAWEKAGRGVSWTQVALGPSSLAVNVQVVTFPSCVPWRFPSQTPPWTLQKALASLCDSQPLILVLVSWLPRSIQQL